VIGRISDRATFLALRRPPHRVRRGPINVSWSADGSQPPRVAYAIGRGTGGAVVRNRLRRRLRAILSEHEQILAPGAYLIGARPHAAGLSYAELRENVLGALSQLAASSSPAGNSPDST